MASQKNTPDLWRHKLPVPNTDGHKYDRGHAMILASREMTGATALAASACSRVGAGLVSIIAPQNADLYRSILPFDLMVRDAMPETPDRVTAVLAGPGGVDDAQAEILRNLPGHIAKVLDANAIPANGDFSHLAALDVLTPHEGEFAATFSELDGPREKRASEAAKRCGSVVLLKGMPTAIAAPDGRLVTNHHASPYLAKAGTGDVLAGMIAGLIAQGMDSFDAARAACWMHGEAGIRVGPGLTASDLECELRPILKSLLS